MSEKCVRQLFGVGIVKNARLRLWFGGCRHFYRFRICVLVTTTASVSERTRNLPFWFSIVFEKTEKPSETSDLASTHNSLRDAKQSEYVFPRPIQKDDTYLGKPSHYFNGSELLIRERCAVGVLATNKPTNQPTNHTHTINHKIDCESLLLRLP